MAKLQSRYHSLSIILHWSMALGLLFMFASGLYMVYGDMSKAAQYRLFQLHKAAGVVVLWALLLRVAVRVVTSAPKLPSSLNKQQVRNAKAGHLMLYIALFSMTLSGWLMVSASPYGLPTFVFVDWIKWPHIPGVARDKVIASLANKTHWLSAMGLGTLILGHIGALVWHKRKHNLSLLPRMWWVNSKQQENERNG